VEHVNRRLGMGDCRGIVVCIVRLSHVLLSVLLIVDLLVLVLVLKDARVVELVVLQGGKVRIGRGRLGIFVRIP